MDDTTNKTAATTQTQQQRPSNPLLTVQTAKPETQNRNFELNTAKNIPKKKGL